MSDDDVNEKIRKALEECGKSTEKSALAKIDDATDGGVVRMLAKLFGKSEDARDENVAVTPLWPRNRAERRAAARKAN